MDIETYNYYDTIFHLYRSGKLNTGESGKKKGDEELKDNGLNAGVVFQPMTDCPSYLTYKRDNADFMNNFFVNIVARSFTNIEEFLRQQEEDQLQNQNLKTIQELKNIKDDWTESLVREATEQFASYDT